MNSILAALTLFAKPGDIFEVLIPIVVFLLVMVGKLISAIRTPQQPGGPVRPSVPPPRQPQSAPQGQAQASRPKSVKEEIDEFLRRAAQRKQEQMPSDVPVRRLQPARSPMAGRAEAIEAVVVERPVGGEVNEHVKKFLDERQFSERAAKMGGDVAAADTKIEQHLKQVFGHGISKLANQGGETATAPEPEITPYQTDMPALSAAGTGVAAMLNNVDDLRQAIVLNEILQRPVDRW